MNHRRGQPMGSTATTAAERRFHHRTHNHFIARYYSHHHSPVFQICSFSRLMC
ncbi:hypothetical protein Hanom_Chr07g00667081 [Helianthus anomalus]